MAQERTDDAVTVRKADDLKQPPPPSGAQWYEVTIKLSDKQIEGLKKLGVDTSTIKILTYDLSRLGVMSHN